MRTAIYVDGLNLFYGALKGTAYKWLDLNLLCRNILQAHHKINSIVYCTAMVWSPPTDPKKTARQRIHLKALQAHIPHFKLVDKGYFKRMIRKSNLAKSQLPSPIPGTRIRKPESW